MIDIPPLTPQLLDELGQELGGCDFTSENQQSFLSAVTSRDVQAAPGNGKTTLLVAKLALLSRIWASRGEGVCVISHTNAARQEVEKKLSSHPSASAFLSYPHFVGTVTSFIDRFMALPYLRGLGWSVQHIDDDVFAAVALSRLRSKQALVNYRYNNAYALQRFIENLELADDFECRRDVSPQRLKVRRLKRQPGGHTATGKALEELKAEITNDGYYRFGDMIALAHRAIETCPTLAERLHRRFPLVLLDEAQDTNGRQLALLDRVFGSGVAYQRLGDQNQTLYEDETLTSANYWQASEGIIPLNHTRRFGHDIATFSSWLTVRAPQMIQALIERPSRRILILFDKSSIRDVLQTYAEEVRMHWDNVLPPGLDIRAVASRHNPTRDTIGGWPKTLIDYCPTYRSAGGRQARSNALCALLRQVSASYDAHVAPAELAGLIRSAIVRLLGILGTTTGDERTITTQNLWFALRERDSLVSLTLRRLIRNQILLGDAVWNANAWDRFRGDLCAALGAGDPLTAKAATFLEFTPYHEGEQAGHGEQQSATRFLYDGVSIRLGSIHSVKGKTVDSILAVETEVYRGRRLSDRAMDLETVLPHALGLEERDFGDNDAQLAAATNIFVAATRTRHVLAFAMRKCAASDAICDAAGEQGWFVRDLTAGERGQ